MIKSFIPSIYFDTICNFFFTFYFIYFFIFTAETVCLELLDVMVVTENMRTGIPD